MELYKDAVCVSLRTALGLFLRLQETTSDRVKIRAAGRKVDELVDTLDRIEQMEGGQK